MKCHCHDRGTSCVELVPIFQNLSPEEKEEVAAITSEKIFQRGELIYGAGDKHDRLFIIHEGAVKIFRLSPSGKEQVIRVVEPGDFVGELSLFSHLPNTDYAMALSNARMCTIEGARLKELMMKYPTIALTIIQELSERLERAENVIENINLHSVDKRIAQFLLEMMNEKKEILLPMTRGDLASQIGVSQETLSRKLSAFEDQGFIKQVSRREIVILDEFALAELE